MFRELITRHYSASSQWNNQSMGQKGRIYGGKHLVAITQKFVAFTMQFNYFFFFFWGGGLGGVRTKIYFVHERNF